jgi:hypothetical protein
MDAGGTHKRARSSEIKMPVRLLPVVQCMKMAGGGSTKVEAEEDKGGGMVARRCRMTVRNMTAPEVRIVVKASTMP